jgi:predicted choloylglycine hydrolase
MLGRNLDFPSLAIAHAASMVICYEPEGGRRFSGVTWPGFLGILSGMNENGLALAMMLVYGHKRKEHLQGQPFPFVFRRVLAECETVEEAVKFLETRPYCTTTNVMLADKGRHAARLQLHPHKAIVDRSTKEKPALCCTNHFLEKGYRSFAFTWFSSTLRLSRLRKAIASGVPFDEQRIKDVLKKTAIPTINIQRILFMPERLEAEVAIGEVTTAHRQYTKLSRQDLFPLAAPSQKAEAALSSRA